VHRQGGVHTLLMMDYFLNTHMHTHTHTHTHTGGERERGRGGEREKGRMPRAPDSEQDSGHPRKGTDTEGRGIVTPQSTLECGLNILHMCA
jgi:hypothetical protein